MALTEEQLMLVVSLETQLIAMDAVMRELEALQASQSTRTAARGRVREILSDLSAQYALLYPQYKAAEIGQSHLQPPSEEQFAKISALANQVETYIKGQKTTEATLAIAEQAIDLLNAATA